MTIKNETEAFDVLARVRYVVDEIARGPGWGERLRAKYIAAGAPYGDTDEGALRWIGEQRSSEVNAL